VNKIILFLFTICFAQSLNLPTQPLILTDVILTQNLKLNHLSSGGGSIGGFGGGDTTDRRRLAAWFYGDRQILTCLQINKNFEINQVEIIDYLNASLFHWKQYFKQKKINDHLTEKINLNFHLKQKCEGGEDLVLYFGTGPIFQNLLDLRAYQALSNPVAYANKTHMSSDYKWSKGYIRFVESHSYIYESDFFPNWTNKDHFYQILTHELGHILGFSHVPGTIMTGSIVRDTLMENKKFKSIDQTDELHPCEDCIEIYNLVKTYDEVLFPKNSEIVINNTKVKIISDTSVEIEPISILKTEQPLNLISLFEPESHLLDMNKIYFLKYLNNDLVIYSEKLSLKIFKNGSLVSEFRKDVL
jgi:hypothetical protein